LAFCVFDFVFHALLGLPGYVFFCHETTYVPYDHTDMFHQQLSSVHSTPAVIFPLSFVSGRFQYATDRDSGKLRLLGFARSQSSRVEISLLSLLPLCRMTVSRRGSILYISKTFSLACIWQGSNEYTKL
jgi:hypothetical protein